MEVLLWEIHHYSVLIVEIFSVFLPSSSSGGVCFLAKTAARGNGRLVIVVSCPAALSSSSPHNISTSSTRYQYYKTITAGAYCFQIQQIESIQYYYLQGRTDVRSNHPLALRLVATQRRSACNDLHRLSLLTGDGGGSGGSAKAPRDPRAVDLVLKWFSTDTYCLAPEGGVLIAFVFFDCWD